MASFNQFSTLMLSCSWAYIVAKPHKRITNKNIRFINNIYTWLPLMKGAGGCSIGHEKQTIKPIQWDIPLAPFTRGRRKYQQLLFLFSFQISNRLTLTNHLTLLNCDFYNATSETNMNFFKATPWCRDVAEEVILIVLGTHRW